MFASRMMRRVARKLAEVRARDARSRPFTRVSTLPIGGIAVDETRLGRVLDRAIVASI